MVILVDKREKNIDHLIKYFDKAKIEYKNIDNIKMQKNENAKSLI